MESPIRDVHEDVLKLQAYLETMPDGERLSYLRIEHDTGVIMDTTGRARIGRAMHRLRRVHRTIRGEGIELGGPDNAVAIIVSGADKISSAVKRLNKKHEIVTERHVPQMNEQDRRYTVLVGSVLAAFKQCSNIARRLYGKEEPKLVQTIQIPFPEEKA